MDDGYEDLVLDDEDKEYAPGTRWWSPGSLLTGGTSAITALVFAYASLGNWLGFPVAEALLGFPQGPDDMRDRAIVASLIVLLLLFGALWLAGRVFVDDDDQAPQWVRHVAGSAVVIAVVGTVLSLLTIAGSLLADTPSRSGRPF